MNFVCPTITAANLDEYVNELNKVKDFSNRIHLDLMDGILAPTRSLPVTDISWPNNLIVDVHVMFDQPNDVVDQLLNLKPSLVIIHAEANVDLKLIASKLHSNNIKAGIAILPATGVDSIKELITSLDHVLIFAGHLGYQGGKSDLTQTVKIKELKKLGFKGEIAWDGGINEDNISELANSGINVFDVGGFIQTSDNPHNAYTKLVEMINK